ncbi:MAG: DUF4287 domain-containing protein [Bauldia sp.]|nr:DUF4287 domain-containing protein [Bauldia sp.]
MGESLTEKGRETQLRNIEQKTGRTFAELKALIAATGLSRHGEIRDHLKATLGLGHGDANALTHYALGSDGESRAAVAGASTEDVLADIYAGPKAALRSIHDRFIAALGSFGAYETAPKKGYVSLRRKKQFVMVGPGPRGTVEIGFNMKGVEPTARLAALPPGGMCQFRTRVTEAAEIDAELIAWARIAFDAAG